MPVLKIAIAQLNYTIGDFAGNGAAIVDHIQKAAADHADMVVFSELSLCGYYPGDLLEEPAFLNKLDAQLNAILQRTRNTPVLAVIGAPRRRPGPGKPLHNALLALREGEIVAEYFKQLLPTYGVFDEHRHFEPGPEGACVLNVAGRKIGFLVCEDGWNDLKESYAIDPFEALAIARPDLVVCINASPSDIGKRALRHDIFQSASVGNNLPILYVNQIGGQDQLVFDGGSFAVSPAQGIAFEAERFSEDYRIIGFDAGRFVEPDGTALPKPDETGLSNMEFSRRQIVLGLRDYARRCGFSQGVIGSSGGIDSALTLVLATEALGRDNVFAVTMPSEYSSAGSVSDSEMLCANLGIRLFTHPIHALVDGYKQGFAEVFGTPLVGLPLQNLQARIRGTILMEHSNAFNALLLNTGNKSEVSVGYCTLYGDTNGGLGLIGDLYKTEVYALTRYLNDVAGGNLVPADVLTKPPSAELAPGQLDTDSLPPYDLLDPILKWHIEGYRLPPDEARTVNACVEQLLKTDDGRSLVERVLRMVARNEYKRRQAPPIIRIRPRAFGSGRRMPIAAKY